MAMTAPPWLESMLAAISPLWLALSLGFDQSRHTIRMSRDHGDFAPIFVGWALRVIETNVQRRLSLRDVDITASIVHGLGAFCLAVRNQWSGDKEFIAEWQDHFCELGLQLVLQYPDHGKLWHAFVKTVVQPDQAWPPDVLSMLIRHALHMSLLNEEDVRLAMENAMDYWWKALEPEITDSDARAVSLHFFRSEAHKNFPIVRDEFLRHIEDLTIAPNGLEVALRYITVLVEEDCQDLDVQRAASILLTRAIPMDSPPVAWAWTYLLRPLITATHDLELIGLAQRVAREWLIVGDGEIRRLNVTIAFYIISRLCELNAIPDDMTEGILKCAGECLTSIGTDVLSHFLEIIPGPDWAAIIADHLFDEIENCLPLENEIECMREIHRLNRMIDSLCCLWTTNGLMVDIAPVEKLFQMAIENAESPIFEPCLYNVLRGVLAQAGLDHELGQRCLQEMIQVLQQSPVFIPDFIQALFPFFSRNWHIFPLPFILEIIQVTDRDILARFEDFELILYFTFGCRVIWGAEENVVQEWTNGQLESLTSLAVLDESESANIRNRLLEILEMEVVLTRLAAGIVDEDRIPKILGNLPQLAISDYHRLLAVLTLGPLVAQNESLAEAFGTTLQAVLENRIDPAAVDEFQAISEWEYFDEKPAPINDLQVPGFVKTSGEK
jgi:hypothetical protein